MPSFEELLAARKSAKAKTVKVPVLLDVDSSDRIAELEEQLEAIAANTDQRLGAVDGAEDVQAEIDSIRAASVGQLITLEFERLPGDLWTDITIRHPARMDSAIDLNYGYNLDEVVKHAAKAERGGHSFAWRIEDDRPTALTAEQWDDLFTVMSGHEFQIIRDAVFSLNEFGPAQAIVNAKKALAGIETGSN